MEDLTKYTITELLKLINNSKVTHETLKSEIIILTNELEMLENKINEKMSEFENVENIYVDLITEYNKRNG